MSLFVAYSDPKFVEISQLIFQQQFRRDPKLHEELDERRKKLMYADITYNISYLMTAVRFEDGGIFVAYARWIYDRLCSQMKDFTRERVGTIMVDHYQVMIEVLLSKGHTVMTEHEVVLAMDYLQLAIETTKELIHEEPSMETLGEDPYEDVRTMYFNALMDGHTEKAYEVVKEARDTGMDLLVLYQEVLAKTMYEIGRLWQKNIITVDKEHYATAVTQMVMSRFYEEIFSRPRKHKTLISCAAGSELHEMGIRMLSDIFEHEGWDTYYLGSGLSLEAMISAVKDHEPQVVALSVTMPPYLNHCEELVRGLREAFPNLLIAVGGQAFRHTKPLWKSWGANFYSERAEDLLRWLEERPTE